MEETILKQYVANALNYIIEKSDVVLTKSDIIDIMTYDIGFDSTLEAENFANEYDIFDFLNY